MPSTSIQFQNQNGFTLSGKIELPITKTKAFAILAHCFTGNKSLGVVRHICRGLNMEGIAVLRFDFTGLGDSEGDFTDTTFTSNVEDIVAAADYLKENYEPARILIGHSLGGAAVIFAAGRISSVRAITTIGAPSQPEHVLHLLEENLEDIERKGIGTFSLAGRKFTVKKQLIDDVPNSQKSQGGDIGHALTSGPNCTNRKCGGDLSCRSSSKKLCHA